MNYNKNKGIFKEEDAVKKMCDEIISMKPDVVFTEKGVSDLAQHFLMKAGVTAIRRLKKTENNRLARYDTLVKEMIICIGQLLL